MSRIVDITDVRYILHEVAFRRYPPAPERGTLGRLIPRKTEFQENSMAFREKHALLTLIAIWIVTAGFVADACLHRPSSLTEAIPALIGAMVLLTAIMIVSSLLLVIGVGAKEARQTSDERERLVRLTSRRNASWLCQAGLWLVLALAAMGASHVWIAYAAIGAFVLGEMVMYGSELFYYRRGV
jgi:hypothetical protein